MPLRSTLSSQRLQGERSKELQAVQKQMEMVEEELRKVKETEKDRVQFLVTTFSNI